MTDSSEVSHSMVPVPGRVGLESNGRHSDATAKLKVDGYVIRHASDTQRPMPPPSYVIEPWMLRSSIGLVVGDSGTGKTTVMLHIGVSIALGLDWLGHRVSRSRRVLFVDQENGVWRLTNRIAQVMRALSAGPEIPLWYVNTTGFNLRDAQRVRDLTALIREVGAEVVILDSFMDFVAGNDENSVKDMLPPLLALRAIAESTGAAIWGIHHLNRSGTYRGSSVIKGQVDTMLMVSRPKPSEPLIRFSFEKHRDFEPFTFDARLTFSEDTISLTPADETDANGDLQGQQWNPSELAVLHYLAEHGPSLMSDIKSGSGAASEESARKAVQSLKQAGMVKRIDAGGAGKEGEYDLDTNDPAALSFAFAHQGNAGDASGDE